MDAGLLTSLYIFIGYIKDYEDSAGANDFIYILLQGSTAFY